MPEKDNTHHSKSMVRIIIETQLYLISFFTSFTVLQPKIINIAIK